MTTATSLTLRRWSAWAPGLSTLENWRSWAEAGGALPAAGEKPKASFLAPGLRRRCSAMTRAALQAIYTCVPEDERSLVRTVFASRHGEAETTLSILETLARDELVSPMEFSLSVHNAASGIFSIAAQNRLPSTAIAAGEATLMAALVESANAVRACKPGESVVCVLAEEPLPEVFRRNGSVDASFFAIAMHLGPEPGNLVIGTEPGGEAASSYDPGSLVRWLLAGGQRFEVSRGTTRTFLSRAASGFADLFAGS